jgi:hypothetical protein
VCELRKQERVTVQTVIIFTLKGWKNSDIWEITERFKILFRKKLRADCNQGMLAVIPRRIFCLLSKNINIKIHRTVVLTVALYGCETWSLTLREGRRLRVFENRALRRIFGPKRDEVTREWRKLHNEEHTDLYCPPNIILVMKSRMLRWAGNVARKGEKRGSYRVLVWEPEGKRQLGRPRCRWEDIIKMDLQEVG